MSIIQIGKRMNKVSPISSENSLCQIHYVIVFKQADLMINVELLLFSYWHLVGCLWTLLISYINICIHCSSLDKFLGLTINKQGCTQETVLIVISAKLVYRTQMTCRKSQGDWQNNIMMQNAGADVRTLNVQTLRFED